jgi:hypothetical protein
MAVNRCGLLVDYSEYAGRPYLTTYPAETIINWKTGIVNGNNILTMVMLEGQIDTQDERDPYKTVKKLEWRELYIEDGIYKARTWHKVKDDFQVIPDSEVIPIINGQPFNFIPFYFVTAEGVNTSIKKSILADFVNLNLGHYKNSADYENMVHWAGAKTVITRGWGERPFPIGGAPDFPIDGGASYLESASDSCILEAMRAKEEQMAALGSQIISGKGRYVASAETSRISAEGEHATLSDISISLSDSITEFMSLVQYWGTGREADVSVEFNTDFEPAELPQGKLIELMGAVQSGYMSMETFFYNMRLYEVYPPKWTDEDEKTAIETSMSKQVNSREKQLEDEILKMKSQTPIEEGTDEPEIVSA